jgi:predicted transcriptional regulator
MSVNKGARTIRESQLARRQQHEAEVLAAIRQGPQSTEDLVMVCNMGRHEVWTHLQSLLDAGKIERETATSNYGGKPHEVGTGRYQAIVRADSHEMECAETLAVSA